MSQYVDVGFVSDLHLGHPLAARSRGFESAEQHDDAIIEQLQKRCNKRTLLWVLGDVAMSLDALKRLGDVLGRKRLVRGNHDDFPLDVYLQYFEDVHGFLRYKQMWLSHCPIHPQEMYRCKLNVHGHIHKNTRSPELPRPYFNVNWDFWRDVVPLHEVIKFRDNSPP